MYQSYWGLQETPFRTRVDRRFFYQSPTHEEALARLHFLVEERRRAGLLVGGYGSGKSLLLEVFADEVRSQGQPVVKMNLTGVGPQEFLGQLAVGFQMNPHPDCPTHGLWQLVADRLAEYRYQEWNTVVLLDDAHSAEQDVLSQVVRLAQLESAPESRLAIVLACRPDRLGQLSSTLLELAELRIDLDPWEAEDTEGFLQTSLAEAGRADPLFEEPAIARLHELGEGVPRRISQLADLALLVGAGSHLERVDADTVESVYHELGVIHV